MYSHLLRLSLHGTVLRHLLPHTYSHLIGLPLHLHGAVLRHLLPRVNVEGHVVEELPEDGVAESIVVQVQLHEGGGGGAVMERC